MALQVSVFMKQMISNKHIRVRVVVLLVACMAVNEEFKIKDKNISLATKRKLFYSYMFGVVTIGSESWTLCKANYWELDAFGMWTWKRPLKIS